ncbi:MAG: 10 kDa chaperonin [Berkelbacteria bacterium GW2011_GWA1_36_9]|uniref:Co-chaperonin GroES n=1 Tax=Berkelbacteria bacterium GW2011_GWA1_36_9 TaxID=1618331 RepID=A0A0G0IRR9_9BACT|nr:MAG: 10 kDa chaperonin [Berkelbacteria bacterium GW2011_GWA1_36_9]
MGVRLSPFRLPSTSEESPNFYSLKNNINKIVERCFVKIKPLADRVVVKPIDEESKTKSGIIIPDTAKEKSHRGEVIAVGPGKYDDGKLVELGVKIGDKVLYKEYSGDEFKLDGNIVIILKEEDIIAVIES